MQSLGDWLQAADRGDVAAAIAYLEAGGDIDAGNAIHVTALMRAVRGGYVDLVRMLIDRGASLGLENSLGHSALTVALIRSGINRDRHDTSHQDRGPLELLLAAGARYELREAVMRNDVELARTRLDEGADPNTGEFKYEGPLLKIAAGLGFFAVVELLLERGANIEATDDLGGTALLSAARSGHIAIVRLLLDRGAEINHDDWSDQTALSEAAVGGHRHIVELLLSRGAERGLLDAVALDDADLVEDLLRGGGDPNHLYCGNGRLITNAVKRGNVNIVRLLLDHGGELFHPRFDRRPLLDEARERGHEEVAKLLIDRGASTGV